MGVRSQDSWKRKVPPFRCNNTGQDGKGSPNEKHKDQDEGDPPQGGAPRGEKGPRLECLCNHGPRTLRKRVLPVF